MGPLMGILGKAAMSRLAAMPGNLGKAATAAQKLGGNLMAAKDFAMTLAKEIDKTAKEMIHLADSMGGRWVQLEDIAFKTARTMAMSREQAKLYNQELLSATRDLAAQYGISAREMANFQKTYAEAVGRNVILTREQVSHMAALSKITDSATAQKLVDEFDKVGAGIDRATAYAGRLQERAKALGVSPSKATKMMADNIKLAASYSFRNGVNDIEKMALKATSLRMDMNAVMNATEKFANIENAITNSANIQLLGGSFAQNFSNPMGAMYEAMADPNAFMDRVLKTIEGNGRYDEKTGTVQFDPVTMMQMREMAKTLGMSVEQLTNPAMAKVQNARVEQELINSGARGRFTDKELELLQNLSRTNVDDNGKHFVTLFENGEEHQVEISKLTNEQLQLAKDSQLTEEQMFDDVQQIKEILERVHGRARDTQSTKERERGLTDWWDSLVMRIQNWYMPKVSDAYKGVTNATGTKHFSTGGIATPLHAADGMIVPGDSYVGDKVPAMLNSGEMVLNPMQQKSMFNMIQSLAMSGGMVYGMNKLGGKMGVGGLGSTMILANALGGEDTGISEIIEAHYLKKFLKSLSPFEKSIKEIGEAAEAATEQTDTFGTKFSDFGKKWKGIFGDLTKNARVSTKKFFTTGKLGKVTNGINQASSFIKGKTRGAKASVASYLKTFGKTISEKTVKPLSSKLTSVTDAIKSTDTAKRLKAFTDGVKGSSYNRAAKRFTTATGQFKKAGEVGGKFAQNIVKAKGYGQEFSRDIKNLLKSSKAGKAVSKVAEGTKGITNTLKGSKALGYVGKAGKVLGKVAKPLNAVLSVAGAVGGIAGAKSEYDKKVEELNNKSMSAKDRAVAKDKAEKERNASIGSSVGKTAGNIGGWAAGAAAGAALGSVVPVVGTAIGGLLGGLLGSHYGEKALGWVGGKVGGMFGGNNAEKIEKPAHAQNGLIVPGDSYTGDKVPVMANSKEMILTQKQQSTLFNAISNPISSAVKALPDLSSFMKVLPPVALASAATRAIGGGKTDVNLHVSGTIKLEGNGKSVDFDISKLLDTPEFKRQITDIVTRTWNENSNSGKRNMESERNNMAKQYNKSGS